MIYLILDTNIWVNSLNDNEYPVIEKLEYLIENNHVTILLPEIIIEEWNRNRDNKKQNWIKIWKSFVDKAKDIFSADLVNRVVTPDYIEKKAEEQILRVEKIFNFHAIKIPITDEYKLKATILAEQKKAPFGTKNSIGDAYIFLSIIDYISKNNLSNCVFITGNSDDFSSKEHKHQIHSDLEPEFTRLNIKYYIDLGRFFHEYSSQLPNITEYKKLKLLKEESQKLASAIFNPQALDSFTEFGSSYIENINHLDLILKMSNPTKEQAIFALGLLDSDESYKKYFFRNVKNRAWFKILQERGFFHPSKIPDLIKVEKGFMAPSWEVLCYLENLSLQIKEGNELDLIDELMAVIRNVSENPKDNYHTWYVFIRILANIPNDKIPTDIFTLIPVWFSGKFNTGLQTDFICEQLLLKFLNEEPTQGDIEKAEKILHYIFQINKKEPIENDFWNRNENSFYSIMDLSFVVNRFIDLCPKIVKHCSSTFILELGRTIKYLLLDYPDGINTILQDNGKEYEIKIRIEKENLLIASKLSNSENDNAPFTLANYEDLSENDLTKNIISILKTQDINYTPCKSIDDVVTRLSAASNFAANFRIDFYSIRNLGDRYYSIEIVEVFSLIFRDFLNEKAKQTPIEAISLLKTFCFDKKYQHPFYKQITLYIICENWDTTKSLFWELLKNDDALKLFSIYKYRKELYDLLHQNQKALTTDEKVIIQNIIERGKQKEDKEEIDDDLEYWQQRWYSALREIEPFNERYLQLAKKLNITSEHYENDGIVQFRSGSTSPYSVDEILEKSNKEIVDFIHVFNPKDRWEEPTVGGLANILGEAIEREPKKFTDEIDLYVDVYYIYAYYMAEGFSKAWRSKKQFDWEKVLNFFKKYISSKKFTSEQLHLKNDDWGATSNWILGAVANLLTDGMCTDDNAFDLTLLSIAKEILQIIVPRLEAINDFKKMNANYPTYLCNSTAGKANIALLEYSLRRARNLGSENTLPKWEQEIKDLFEEILKKEIIDGFILLGLYFQQFYFLDKDWTTDIIKKCHKLEDNEWAAFMGGYASCNPLPKKDIYQLFQPHYKRVIENDIQIINPYVHGIIRHIVIYYLWDFEDLTKEGLLLTLINKDNHDYNLEFVNFIWRQSEYFKSLDNEEIKNFEKKVLHLWNYLASKYSDSEGEDEQKVLSALLNFHVFVSELNEESTTLILKSCSVRCEHFHTRELFENLNQLKDKGVPQETAKYIGIILNSIQFTSYFPSLLDQLIENLLIFLNANGQEQMVKEFCEKMAKQGVDSYIELYNKLIHKQNNDKR